MYTQHAKLINEVDEKKKNGQNSSVKPMPSSPTCAGNRYFIMKGRHCSGVTSSFLSLSHILTFTPESTLLLLH